MTNVTLVDLDSLLDTRLAIISQIDPEAAVRLVTSPDYYTRKKDDFSHIAGIDNKVYEQAWKNRTADILPHAIKTHVPLLLHELISRLEVQEETIPEIKPPELEINIWPYMDLTEEERLAICDAVLIHVGIQTIPRVVCIDPKTLTPRVLKRGYAGLILYDLRGWLMHHIEQFPKCICPDLAILTPALLYGQVVDTPDITKDSDVKTDLSIFSMTELACVEFFQLNYLETKYFSIWRP